MTQTFDQSTRSEAPIRAVYGRDPEGNVFELLEFRGDTPFDYAPSWTGWRKK